MKSTLFNMVMVLFVITLLASAGVGAAHMITEEPIAEARVKATREALKQVLPEFDETEDTALTVENLPVTVHTASEGGRVVGYAVESMTKNGFSGVIRLMVGFAPDGQILNIRVLEQAETPGLGTKMVDAGNSLEKSFVKLGVKKDGGDVDALTAATISSRAYVDAVSRAYKAYCEKAGVEAAVNTVSGASNTQNAGADGTSGASATRDAGADGASGASNNQETGTEAATGATAARPNAEAGTRAAGEERYRERGLEREGRSNRLQRGSQTVNNAQEGGRNE
mgnify:CR=1 FL=1